MFDWLFEGHRSVYIVLGVVAFLFLHLWVRNRKRSQLIIVGLALALIGVYYLLDRLIETDREKIVATVRLMAASANEKDLDVSFSHISEGFHSPSGRGKADLRAYAEQQIRAAGVKGVTVWGFGFPQRPERDRENKVTFEFKIQADLGGREAIALSCEALFVHESPGVWRMLWARVMNPAFQEEAPFQF